MAMRETELFEEFCKDLATSLGAKEYADISLKDRPDVVLSILDSINRFFYQQYVKDDQKYISRFHRFWELNHEEMLGFQIDEEQCSQVAAVLERIFAQKPFKVELGVKGLSQSLIANTRFFTIVQDFKIRFRREPYVLSREKPELFEAQKILDNFPSYINELLEYLGAKSQIDKRHKFSKLCAEILMEQYEGDANKIASKHDYDAKKIIKALAENYDEKYNRKLGFSDKKAIIFVRDMMDLGIWEISNPQELDLPSDANTMRVALRTGILGVRRPLMASYLDVYCYQYEATDAWCRKAWREVWNKWGEIPNNHRVNSPASFDFLIYRFGQNWNKPDKMPDVNLFRSLCPPKRAKLNPPKSISRLGATGWESGRTDEGGGGGIMA